MDVDRRGGCHKGVTEKKCSRSQSRVEEKDKPRRKTPEQAYVLLFKSRRMSKKKGEKNLV